MTDDGTLNTSHSEKDTISCSCDNIDGDSESSTSSSLADFEFLDGDFLAVLLGVITLLGSVVAYFVQRNVERKEEAAADKRALNDLDRQQALERVRQQLSVYVGPLHRLVKTQNAMRAQYCQATNKMASQASYTAWSHFLLNNLLDPYLEDPMCLEAKRYRSFVIHRLKPIYEQIRVLVLDHGSNLAEFPTQDEYLKVFDEKQVISPYVGSINVNVIFDTYCVWSFEFDDIVECWKEGDFSRMQPTTKVAWRLCNYLADFMYNNAKEKEAKYNKHVKVHQNVRQEGTNTMRYVKEWLEQDDQEDNKGSIRELGTSLITKPREGPPERVIASRGRQSQ